MHFTFIVIMCIFIYFSFSSIFDMSKIMQDKDLTKIMFIVMNIINIYNLIWIHHLSKTKEDKIIIS
jgi:hypothetical protein